jgi:outer membrane murein-binding lipoprotein Lpp
MVVLQGQEQSKTIDSLTMTNSSLSDQIQAKEGQLLKAKLEFNKAEEGAREVNAKTGTLQLEINRLRSQVASVGEENDDLKAQLLKQNIERARELAEQSSASLAAEIDTVDKSTNISINNGSGGSSGHVEQLQRELKTSQANNDQMRQYLDKILQSILEKDPSILEVK